jgi:hypothetical protein
VNEYHTRGMFFFGGLIVLLLMVWVAIRPKPHVVDNPVLVGERVLFHLRDGTLCIAGPGKPYGYVLCAWTDQTPDPNLIQWKDKTK